MISLGKDIDPKQILGYWPASIEPTDSREQSMVARKKIAKLLGLLSEDERIILSQLKGLNGYEKVSQAELARRKSVSRNAICKREKLILLKLRRFSALGLKEPYR